MLYGTNLRTFGKILLPYFVSTALHFLSFKVPVVNGIVDVFWDATRIC
jgi:hypothetical protein